MECSHCGSELTLEQEVKLLRKKIDKLETELKIRPVIFVDRPYQTYTAPYYVNAPYCVCISD